MHKCNLTDREVEILELVALGYTNQMIADKLHYSFNYVCGGSNGLIGRIYTKLGMHHSDNEANCVRAAAVAVAFRLGVLK